MHSQEGVTAREKVSIEEAENLERLKKLLLSKDEQSLLDKLLKKGINVARNEAKEVGKDKSGKSSADLTTIANLKALRLEREPREQSNRFIDVSFPDAKEEFDEGSEAATDSEVAWEEVDDISMKDIGSRITLKDERWGMNRAINSVKFHTKEDNLVFTAHANHSVQTVNGTGVVNIWGIEGRDSRLQRTLIANSSVTSLLLASVSSTTVLAGTSCGEILMWDLRSKASTISRRSELKSIDPNNKTNHGRSPIYSLETGRKKGEFVSAATNGTICVWSVSNLSKPLSVTHMNNSDLTGSVRITALKIPSRKSMMGKVSANANVHGLEKCFAGADDGKLYRFEAMEDGALGIAKESAAHYAPVTAMSVHPTSRKRPLVNDMVLSASLDWTVKMSALGLRSSSSAARVAGDFKGCEYSTGIPGFISDVAWSPVHPCMFATGDEYGGVSIFDADRSHQNPRGSSCRHTVYATEKGTIPAVNRVQWSRDGSLLCAGDTSGTLSIWKCGEKIVDSSPLQWERMSNFIKRQKTK